MIAVIFEVQPLEGKQSQYFSIASKLSKDLARIDGFISVERFQSLSDEKKFLSLSFFSDEPAVANWREHIRHREGQAKGRDEVFENYRIRVASVIRDYGMFEREQAPN